MINFIYVFLPSAWFIEIKDWFWLPHNFRIWIGLSAALLLWIITEQTHPSHKVVHHDLNYDCGSSLAKIGCIIGAMISLTLGITWCYSLWDIDTAHEDLPNEDNDEDNDMEVAS